MACRFRRTIMKTKSNHVTLVQTVQPRRTQRRAEGEKDRSFSAYLCDLCGWMYQSWLSCFRKKGAIVVAFALMAMLAKPQFAFAQVTPAPITGSWEGLKAIPPGDEVRVRLRNGQTLKGRLISVSDTAMTLARGDIT